VTRRLLQAIAGAQHGGAETFFVRLAGALQHAGEAQHALIRRHDGRARALRAAGVTVSELGFGGPFDIATRLAFRRAIAAWRPAIVLTWMSRATQFCPAGDFVHVARLGGYYNLKYYARCQHLVGNTQAIVDYAVTQGWPRKRVHYLPNFVPDPRVVATAAAPPVEYPGERPAGRLALAVGRLHSNKGFDLLLDALAMTRDISLWIAGEGPLRADLEHHAAALDLAGRVRFLGWRDDVCSLMAAADFLVCPSRHEPLGNVVIEAWASDLPVVASASAGPAALIEDGESGILVPLPGQPGGGIAALAAAIERVADDPALRLRLAGAGRAAYQAEFTEAAAVARYRRFFDEIAG
jgi:glycosyltransferase involved in cell wall biosynthesis